MATPLPPDSPEAPVFSDGIGQRAIAADAATGDLLEILRVAPALGEGAAFETALRDRTARLANFRHAYYARIRRVERLPEGGLAIVSDHVEGTRLSDILRSAEERGLPLDINTALCLIRQLVPAVALLHENARDVAHGLIAPERLVITPHARLVIVEHVLGSAIEQLRLTRDRLWQDLRVAVPSSAGLSRCDQRADVTAVGLVALALLIGRPLRADEYPHGLPSLLSQVRERSALGDEAPLSAPLREWLNRALQLDPRRPFVSAVEALAVLEDIVSNGVAYVAAPVALETFLARYTTALLEMPPVQVWPPVAPAVHEPEAGPDLEASDDLEDLEAELFAAPKLFDLQPIRPAVTPATADPTPADLSPAVPPSTEAGPDLAEPAGSEAPVLAAIEDAQAQPIAEDEPADAPPVPVEHARPPRRGRAMAVAAAVVVLAATGYAAPRFFRGPDTGLLDVQSSPSGLAVVVDGQPQGNTPARLTVKAGPHILELRGHGVPRVANVQVSGGGETSQYFEFANTPQTGRLHVQSPPGGARVLVDGVPRGNAPVTVLDLLPGTHEVTFQSASGDVRQMVNVQAGGVASVIAPGGGDTASGPISGWMTVTSAVSVEVREGGKLVGTSDADRLMFAAGRHEIELTNSVLGYRATRTVQVAPGKTVAITVDLPTGSVSLNASPWAEVFIDGQPAGETPVGNLRVPIGPHEVLFRNPQLGERRHAISVTVGAPIRLSVDMK